MLFFPRREDYYRKIILVIFPYIYISMRFYYSHALHLLLSTLLFDKISTEEGLQYNKGLHNNNKKKKKRVEIQCEKAKGFFFEIYNHLDSRKWEKFHDKSTPRAFQKCQRSRFAIFCLTYLLLQYFMLLRMHAHIKYIPILRRLWKHCKRSNTSWKVTS